MKDLLITTKMCYNHEKFKKLGLNSWKLTWINGKYEKWSRFTKHELIKSEVDKQNSNSLGLWQMKAVRSFYGK